MLTRFTLLKTAPDAPSARAPAVPAVAPAAGGLPSDLAEDVFAHRVQAAGPHREHLDALVGASPHYRRRNAGALNRRFGLVRRTAVRVGHFEPVVFADVALADRLAGMALAVGIVIDHTGGDDRRCRPLRLELRLELLRRRRPG